MRTFVGDKGVDDPARSTVCGVSGRSPHVHARVAEVKHCEESGDEVVEYSGVLVCIKHIGRRVRDLSEVILVARRIAVLLDIIIVIVIVIIPVRPPTLIDGLFEGRGAKRVGIGKAGDREVAILGHHKAIQAESAVYETVGVELGQRKEAHTQHLLRKSWGDIVAVHLVESPCFLLKGGEMADLVRRT